MPGCVSGHTLKGVMRKTGVCGPWNLGSTQELNLGSCAMFQSCQARPSAEREGQGLTDNTLWKLGEAGRSSRSYRDPRDREVPFGQSSTCEWETEAKAALGSGRFLVGGFCSEYPVDTAGQACSESCCSFPFSSVSQLPSSRAPQTWGFCPVTVGARPDNKVGTGEATPGLRQVGCRVGCESLGWQAKLVSIVSESGWAVVGWGSPSAPGTVVIQAGPQPSRCFFSKLFHSIPVLGAREDEQGCISQAACGPWGRTGGTGGSGGNHNEGVASPALSGTSRAGLT